MTGWQARAANDLTISRFLLSPLFTLALSQYRLSLRGWLALGIFIVAALSDLLDGPLARSLGADGPRGRRLDAAADISFILPALVLLACQGRVPVLLPLAVSVAFAPFALNLFCFPVKTHAEPTAADHLGHLGGIANWIVAGIAAAAWSPAGSSALESALYPTGAVATALNFSAASLHLIVTARGMRHLPENSSSVRETGP